MSLYQQVRPKTLDEIVGQEEAVVILRKALAAADRPHAYLFHGPSGCGKTTMARIVGRELGCEVKDDGVSTIDYTEVNASNTRGIDDMRQLISDSAYPPMTGGVRVVTLDECHRATPDAQNCMLKPLEDAPAHQYWCLCTTEPNKILNTIRTRCVHVPVKPLSGDDIFDLLVAVVERHDLADPGDDILDAIASRADGCPRSAVTMLEQCLGLPPDAAMTAISNYQTKYQEAIELCRMLIRRADWATIAACYSKLEEKEPESLRRMALGYLRSCLLKAKKPGDAGVIVGAIEELAEPTYNGGEAQLLAMLWRASRSGKD